MLTRPFLKNLATKAHQFNPVVMIGAKGLTPQVHVEVDAALLAHELIKVKVNAATRESRDAMIKEMADQLNFRDHFPALELIHDLFHRRPAFRAALIIGSK